MWFYGPIYTSAQFSCRGKEGSKEKVAIGIGQGSLSCPVLRWTFSLFGYERYSMLYCMILSSEKDVAPFTSLNFFFFFKNLV